MKISGFTVIRNAELMGYPIRESIRSALPLVDEFVVGVGQSDDQTKAMLEGLGSPKVRLFDSHWDTSKTKGGLILSEKTNEALAQCQYDWCLYLQADEVLHEQDLDPIRRACEKYDSNPHIQGLLFDYFHFYGAYDTIATSRRWYRREVRMVRRSCGIQSVGDAQSFRVQGDKPVVARSGARIFHYGWVKPPQAMGQKSKLLNRWWHGNRRDREFDRFEFDQKQYGLRPYHGPHPQVMDELRKKQDWKFHPDRSLSDWTLKDLNLLASDLFEKVFRFRIGEYKPYRLRD